MKSLSRRVVVINGKMMKIYDSLWPVSILDFFRMILSVIALKPHADFINVKKRLANELLARKKIKGIVLSKIIESSDNFIIEKRLFGVNAEDFLKKTHDVKVAYVIGKSIGKLHKSNMALVDNRPVNYIVSKGKIFRVDLEMFKLKANEFDKMCDLLSFAEDFDDEKIKSAFLKGHGVYCSCGYRGYVGYMSKLFLRIIRHLE